MRRKLKLKTEDKNSMSKLNEVVNDKNILKLNGITISSNIDDPGVREHVTICLCEVTLEFQKKYGIKTNKDIE